MELSFEELKELKEGDNIVEYGYMTSIQSKLITNATYSNDGEYEQIRFSAISGSDTIDYLFTKNYMHYCPKIERV